MRVRMTNNGKERLELLNKVREMGFLNEQGNKEYWALEMLSSVIWGTAGKPTGIYLAGAIRRSNRTKNEEIKQLAVELISKYTEEYED